ncbi:MAG: DEAD/DEAH box helicase [Pseudomonadota bacterium]
MHFTINDIKEMAPGTTFDRGLQYYHQRRATIRQNYPEQSRFIASVMGSGRNTYRVELSAENGILIGDCSCPIGGDCKHAVAAALQWLQENKAGTSTVQTSTAIKQKPSALESWLTELPTALARPEDSLIPGQHYLLYELMIVKTQVHVAFKKAYLKKDGKWSQITHYTPDYYSLRWDTPRHLQPLDLTILQLLPRVSGYTTCELSGEATRLALGHMLESKRLLFAERTVHKAAPENVQWQWKKTTSDYALHACIKGRNQWLMIETIPPCYLDIDSAEIGDLITPLAPQQFTHLRKMPPVPVDKIFDVALTLRQIFKADQLSVPVEVPEIIHVTEPIPCLTLVAAQVYPDATLPAVLLHYEYADEVCPPTYVTGKEPTYEPRQIDGKHLLIVRDFHREAQHIEQIHALGLYLFDTLGGHAHAWAPEPSTPEKLIPFWEHFIDTHIPELEKLGWKVNAADDFSLTVTGTAFDFSIQDEPNHWFELALTLPLNDGSNLNTADVVEMWLNRGAPAEMMVVVDNQWLRVDTSPLGTIRDLLTELYSRKQLNKPIRLAAFQVAQLQDLPNLDDRAAPLTKGLLTQLQDFTGIEAIAVSPKLQAELRPYQQDGLNWLAFLRRYSLGGILADDMGLGKTLQALAFLQHLKDSGALTQPALIVAPTSLTGNWMHETARFTPDLKITLIHGPDRAATFKEIKRSDVVLTTYPLLLRDSKQYEKHTFSVMILDEAQVIKNPANKVTQLVHKVNSQMRLCLTGTPLENHLGELWSLMDFVLPGLLGGRKTFQEQFRSPIEKNGNLDRQTALARRVAPFMLRRTKSQVVKELPAKTEIVQYVELQGKQRALYESIRVSMEKRIRDLVASQGMQRSHIQFLDALLKLRQACIDPRLVKLEKAANIREHAKLEWLTETLPQLLEEGRSILIFSQFTEVLALIEEELKILNIGYAKLTGQTRKRQEAIDLFQGGTVRVFLISLKAGGSGLNLTAADVVIHMDPWWNPAVENQATDRAHRIGQDKPVFVYKLVASDTVEERIQQMQQQKQALADNLFNEAGAVGQPTDKETLLSLLSG